MLEENEKTMRLSRENEAWLLKALNEKTRALKIAAKANNASENYLAQTKENASLLEKDMAEHYGKDKGFETPPGEERNARGKSWRRRLRDTERR